MEQRICQSCGMPMQKEEDFARNSDGSKNPDYCHFCYNDGRFIDECNSIEEKITKNVNLAIKMGMNKEEAESLAHSILPNLKRWKIKKT